MKIGFVSLGCSKNLVDSERVMGLLKANGHTITNAPAEAEAIFINTCGFIDPAKKEGIDTILEMADYKQGNCKKLIVLGCLAQRYKTELEADLPEVDRFIGVADYPHLSEILTEELGVDIKGSYGKMERLLTTKPYTAYLKISEGCSNRCTYCAIPLIRGNMVSYPMEDILDEAHKLARQGVKELVLIAQDTTRYGEDMGEARLPELLYKLNEIRGFKWIRILYMYPNAVSDELLEAMRSNDKVIPYFDIPVQHADDAVLAKMNRKGNADGLREVIARIRSVFPDAILRTTMMVGFPSETEEQFQTLLDFTSEIGFDRLGAFTYSPEEDTAAYDMVDQVEEPIKQDRIRRLMELQETIAQRKGEQWIGRIIDVLNESRDVNAYEYHGRSIHSAPDNIDGEVRFTSSRLIRSGEFVKVRIDYALGHDLIGTEVI
jgi:ribosomal protein S12 methylthiotransferase